MSSSLGPLANNTGTPFASKFVGAVVGVGALVLVGVVVVDHWAYRVTLADNARFDSAAMSSPVPSDEVFHPIKV